MAAVYIYNAPNTTRTAAEKNLIVSHVKRLLRRHPDLTAAGKAMIQVKMARKSPAAHSTPKLAIELSPAVSPLGTGSDKPGRNTGRLGGI
jgi:hypothetical protein